MERVRHKYTNWEDYKHGMYDISKDSDKMKDCAESLLKNPEKFEKVAKRVLEEWKLSAEENLTNDSANKNAWLGQASCCLEFGVPEISTKKAWGRLDEFQQFRANKVARNLIADWTDKYLKLSDKQISFIENETKN